VTAVYVGCPFVSQWVAGLYSVLACLRESVLACDKNATRAPAIAARHQAAAWKEHSALRAFLGHDNTPTPAMARDGLEGMASETKEWRPPAQQPEDAVQAAPTQAGCTSTTIQGICRLVRYTCSASPDNRRCLLPSLPCHCVHEPGRKVTYDTSDVRLMKQRFPKSSSDIRPSV
jgi:hypothetical protein